jgi:Trk K+ transport system NAD-binding subunit
MKYLIAQLAVFTQDRRARQNVRTLLRLVLLLVVMVVVFSVAFHLLMEAEGQRHSWLTGFYWTLTVMSTLGFGDITFRSDAGRFFSMVVMLSGVLFLLVLLPFTFIQFFYAPWMEAQRQMRAPRELPPEEQGHVIITRHDPVAISLIGRLRLYDRPYVVLESDVARALELHDAGVRVAVGAADDAETYRRLRADRAALVVACADDFLNTNIAFTVREQTETTPIVAVARDHDSVDVLELAGATHVLELADMLGRSLARRTLGGETRANTIAQYGALVIAEAPVFGTPLAGQRLADSQLAQATGVTVLGVWARGHFSHVGPDTRLDPSSVLVLAGSEQQLAAFDELMVIYNRPDAPVLVLGGGRVGRAAAHHLAERGVPYRVVERDASMIRDAEHYVHGSAADLAVLERAGIHHAPTTIVTTNDDATNVYLTVYCRRLRPDMQIISRATLERNISTLHRAGADLVMSYASMGADAILNVLQQNDLFMVAEGLDVFRYRAPAELVGRTLAETRVRERTGCSVVAIEADGDVAVSPPAEARVPHDADLILIGTPSSEQRFREAFARRGRR